MVRVRPAVGFATAVCLACGIATAGSDATDKALKSLTKATKGLRGAVAEIEYSEVAGQRPIVGSGKLYVHYNGFLRLEIGGDDPHTMLLARPYLFVHDHADRVVEAYDLSTNANRLGQYVLLGFAPTGRELEERFDVQLAANRELDGKPVVSLVLTPNRKKAPRAAEAIARIQLWLDPESGFPVKQQIVHAQGLAELTVRYHEIVADDTLPDSLFRPEWPEGVTTVRK